jgi:hypothetical protein
MRIDRPVTVTALTLVLGLASLPASAALINVNFTVDASIDPTNYTGLGAAPDANGNTFWNRVGLGAVNNLLFSDGTTTSTVGISSSGFAGAFSNLVINNVPPPNALLGTRIIKTDGDITPATVTLTGLTPGARYALYAYTGYYSTSFAVGAISGTAAGTGFTENNPANWTEGTQYARLLSVSADGSGVLTLTVTGISPNATTQFTPTTVIAGLQLASIDSPPTVPEPSVGFGLLGIGLLGMLSPLARGLKK